MHSVCDVIQRRREEEKEEERELKDRK